MSATTNPRMTADEFIAWAMEQPEGQRYELVAGEVFAMSPERAVHARTKLRFATKLAAAIEALRLPCEVFGDGMAVRVDAATVYEPDAMVRCGPAIDDDATEISDPLVVIEVVSPSSHKRDSGSKLEQHQPDWNSPVDKVARQNNDLEHADVTGAKPRTATAIGSAD